SACAAVGVFGRIGAGTQIEDAITSGFCRPSTVGPYDERYIPRRARLSELWSSSPPTAMHDGALAGGTTGWPGTCPAFPTAQTTRMPSREHSSTACETGS